MSTDSVVLSQAHYLHEVQNDDGGWGIEAGYPSSPTNTAEALTGLHAATAPVPAAVERRAVGFLLEHQNRAGGWGSRTQRGPAGTCRTLPTAWAIRALSLCAPSEPAGAALDRAWGYLLAQQSSSGAWVEFGSAVQSVTATCHALHALLSARWTSDPQRRAESIDRGLTWLGEIQRDGRVGFTATDPPRLSATVYAAFVASRAQREGLPHHLAPVIDNVRQIARQAHPGLFVPEVEAGLGTFPSQHEHCMVPVLVATLLSIGEPPRVLWPFMRQLWKMQELGRGVSAEPGGRHTTWATAQWLLAMSELRRALMPQPALARDYERMSGEERALVLKGGGVKGLALAGAVAALEANGQRFDLYAGTSAGAIGALLLAAGYTGEELIDELRALDMKHFLDGPLRQLRNLLTRGALHTGDPVREWVRRRAEARLDVTGTVRMRHLGRRALVFAANDDGTVVFDSHGEYRDAPVDFAARCSMSIPYFFADPRHEGAPIYDGGLLNNFPVHELVRVKGDANFIGLYLKDAQLTGLARALTLLRIVRILLNRDEQRTVEHYKGRTVVIDPAPIRTTQFSLSNTAKDFLIAQGRAAALELLARSDVSLANEAAAARGRADALRRQVVADDASRRRRRTAFLVALLLVLAAGGWWFAR